MPKGAFHYSDEVIEQALRLGRGMIVSAAKSLKCSHHTITDRIRRSRHLQKIVKEEREKTLDIVELVLISKAQAGEPWAVCFLLKCIGKHRGYVERQEITGKNGAPVGVSLLELVTAAHAHRNGKERSTTAILSGPNGDN